MFSQFKKIFSNEGKEDTHSMIPSVKDVICVLSKIRAPRHAYYKEEEPEKAVESVIAKQLIEIYGKQNVKRQYAVGGFLSLKCDIDLFDSKCCGIELKLAKSLNATTMQRVIGQVMYYSRRRYKDNGLILLVIGTSSELDPTLNELKSFIEEFPNVYFVYKQAS